MAAPNDAFSEARPLKPLPTLIFASRWLQLPLYLGLIVAQAVYVWHFLVELIHLVEAAFGSASAIELITRNVLTTGLPEDQAAKIVQPRTLTEATIMLVVLGLVDVVMISNLLIMVIVGGYETFVSRMNLSGHPDQPEWLSHVNAAVLKVKLATAIIGISSIHLLKTFINAPNTDEKTMLWQVAIHLTFVASALVISYIDRVMNPAHYERHRYPHLLRERIEHE